MFTNFQKCPFPAGWQPIFLKKNCKNPFYLLTSTKTFFNVSTNQGFPEPQTLM